MGRNLKYVGIMVICFAIGFVTNEFIKSRAESNVDERSKREDCLPISNRMQGFRFIKPLLFHDILCPAHELKSLEERLEKTIQNLQSSNQLSTASVYFRSLNEGIWTEVNPEQKYHLGSLLKVSLLMSYLKTIEQNPNELEKEITITPEMIMQSGKVQYHTDKTLEIGKTYKIKDILEYMIAYSDNNASRIIASRVEFAETIALFKKLNLPVPQSANPDDFLMSAREYAGFFRILYNSTFLSYELSEFGASLMAKSSFIDGMRTAVADKGQVWNKFGEWWDLNQNAELHETALVNIGNRDYIVSIMTRGTDLERLRASLLTLSKEVVSYTTAP